MADLKSPAEALQSAEDTASEETANAPRAAIDPLNQTVDCLDCDD